MTRVFRKSIYGFTMVEIMIVVAIVAILAAIAVPGFLRARKRSHATSVLTDLRLIDSAIDQYALEFNRIHGDVVSPDAWSMYVKPGSRLQETQADIFGNPYGDQLVNFLPKVPGPSWDYLSDVADESFWSPFQRGEDE